MRSSPRTRIHPRPPDGSGCIGIAADERPAQMSLAQGVLIGCAQILAARRFRRNFCDTFGAVGALDANWVSPIAEARRHDPPGPRRVKGVRSWCAGGCIAGLDDRCFLTCPV